MLHPFSTLIQYMAVNPLSKTTLARKSTILIALMSHLLLWTHTAQAETLVDIYELALINDPTLQAAEATYKAGSEIKAQAISQLMPQLNASASYSDSDIDSQSRRFFSADVPPFDSDFETEEESTSYTISLTQSIFNLQAFFAFKQSKALNKQSQLQFAIDQQSLILRSAEAYFDVLRGKDNLASSQSEEKAIQQQLEQTQQRYDVGLIAITDVHEARAAYDLAIVDRLTEEVRLGIAYENLTLITGQSHSSINNLASNFPVTKPQPENSDAWVNFASANNLNIKLAVQLAKASNQNAKVKKAAHLPTIQAVFRYNDSSSDTDQISNGEDGASTALDGAFADQDGTTFEVSLDWPLWHGGLKHSERRQAGYERVRDQANLVAAKRQAFQQTRSSYLTTLTDTARVNARNLAITSARSALDATEAGYDAGTRNIVDLLNAQRDLFRAERDYANTRYDYIINSLKLKEAAGTLSPQDLTDINRWLTPPTPVLKSEQ